MQSIKTGLKREAGRKEKLMSIVRFRVYTITLQREVGIFVKMSFKASIIRDAIKFISTIVFCTAERMEREQYPVVLVEAPKYSFFKTHL